MSINIPYDKIDLGSAFVTYKYKQGQIMPKVGHVIKDESCSMLVVESNEEKRYIKVLLTSTETMESRFVRYKETLEESSVSISKLLYNSMAEGMMSLIGWENLPDIEKTKFLRISSDIITLLDDSNLLVLGPKHLQ